MGILALQGAIEPHQQMLQLLGIETLYVKRATDFEGIDALILPGGESTTQLTLLQFHALWDPLCEFGKQHSVFGTCAGAILMGSAVERRAQQPTLGLIPMTVARNAYGTQKESSWEIVRGREVHWNEAFPAVFIRAPRIVAYDAGVKCLLTRESDPILVEYEHHLAATFHPELSGNTKIHAYFVEKVRARL